MSIPTMLDRLIQQALLQVLQPQIDPIFSEHRHGFRPGRLTHDAVKAARAYVQSGKRVVVDVDLTKFIGRNPHEASADADHVLQFARHRAAASKAVAIPNRAVPSRIGFAVDELAGATSGL